MKNYLLIFLIICFCPIHAQLILESTTLDEREVISGLNIPWEIKWGYDGGRSRRGFIGLRAKWRPSD